MLSRYVYFSFAYTHRFLEEIYGSFEETYGSFEWMCVFFEKIYGSLE